MKHFFNMVEVVLALGVTAIGIAAIMAIIPVSLNASRDAVSDSFVSDIANTQFAELSVASKKDFATAFDGIPTSAGTANKAWIPAATETDGISFDGSNGVYKVSVGRSGKVPDFAGDILIWKWTPTDVIEMVSTQSDIVRVYLEISWPATMAYENREKRSFVREFYKPDFSVHE